MWKTFVVQVISVLFVSRYMKTAASNSGLPGIGKF